MKRSYVLLAGLMVSVFVFIQMAVATTNYVDKYGANPTPNYTNWATAATSIQDAVNVADVGNTVLVTNGNYPLTNQIVVTNGITLQSVNGRNYTFINGNYPNTTNRCLTISNINALVAGFTVSNGYLSSGHGGGIYLYSGVVSNSVVCNNKATNGSGAGIFADTVYSMPPMNIRIYDCVINNNQAKSYGGGVYLKFGTISNCWISSNAATHYGSGGIMMYGSRMLNCEVSYNTGGDYGGVSLEYGTGASSHGVFNCKIIGNRGTYGGIMISYSVLQNSLISGNSATVAAGGVWMRSDSYNTAIYNCTIVSNSPGGGIYCTSTGSKTSFLQNVISYGNIGNGNGSNILFASGNISVSNSCIGMTNGTLPEASCTNIIYADPQFVDFNTGNWRLTAHSPCINSGINQSWMTNAVDLDGRKRIRYGTVDIGAYEKIYEGTIYRMGL